jgi:hypothetical protein
VQPEALGNRVWQGRGRMEWACRPTPLQASRSATSSHNPASSNSREGPSFMYRGESHVQVRTPASTPSCAAGLALPDIGNMLGIWLRQGLSRASPCSWRMQDINAKGREDRVGGLGSGHEDS